MLITIACSGDLDLVPLCAGAVILADVLLARRRGVRSRLAYLLPGWRRGPRSSSPGADPVVAGVVLGLLALVPTRRLRTDLAQAWDHSGCSASSWPSNLPGTPEKSIRLAISPNPAAHLAPVDQYLVVPLFALARANITVSGSTARRFPSTRAAQIILGHSRLTIMLEPPGCRPGRRPRTPSVPGHDRGPQLHHPLSAWGGSQPAESYVKRAS